MYLEQLELFGGGWRKGGVTMRGWGGSSGVKGKTVLFHTSLCSSLSCGTAPPADCMARVCLCGLAAFSVVRCVSLK